MTTVQKYARKKTHEILHPFLNVDLHQGCGISFTYNDEGWTVGTVNNFPGQPDLQRGDVIQQIDGAPLKGLSQRAQTAVFKKYIKHRVQVKVKRKIQEQGWWDAKEARKAQRAADQVEDPWAAGGSRDHRFYSNLNHQKVQCTNAGCPVTCNSQKQLDSHLKLCHYQTEYDPENADAQLAENAEPQSFDVKDPDVRKENDVNVGGAAANDYLASLGLSPSGTPPAAQSPATAAAPPDAGNDYLASLGIQASGIEEAPQSWNTPTYPDPGKWIGQFSGTIQKKLVHLAGNVEPEIFFDCMSSDEMLKGTDCGVTALQRKKILKAFAKLDLG